MKHLPIVIVIAPQGAGKTRNAATLAARFGCMSIVDEWDGVSELQPGTLALTSVAVAELAGVAAVPRDPVIDELIQMSEDAQRSGREVA